MREIFRFWGFGREAWEELVGPGKIIQPLPPGPLETKFGRILFAEEALDLIGDFRDKAVDGITAYVRLSPNPPKGGRVIARLETADRSSSIPLITLDSEGNFHFHFDVDETIEFIQQEKYLKRRSPFYFKLGLSPDTFPAAARRIVLSSFRFSRTCLQNFLSRPPFPAPFKDLSVDLWRFLLREIIRRAAGSRFQPFPLWPEGKRYAVVLTHDVDSEWGFKNPTGIEAFREAEESKGLRSAWLIVSRHESVGRPTLLELLDSGHEIGFHSTYHDHRIAYLCEVEIERQLALAGRFLAEFNCVGFRSPGFHRSESLFRLLDPIIQYDMTLHDSYEDLTSPTPLFEGCSTCFPYRIQETNILEIPTTLTEDITLEMRGISPSGAFECQRNLLAEIRKRQGVANLLTHPEPHLSARPEWFHSYDLLLREIAQDRSAWVALPRELCRWWNDREREIDRAWRKQNVSATV